MLPAGALSLPSDSCSAPQRFQLCQLRRNSFFRFTCCATSGSITTSVRERADSDLSTATRPTSSKALPSVAYELVRQGTALLYGFLACLTVSINSQISSAKSSTHSRHSLLCTDLLELRRGLPHSPLRPCVGGEAKYCRSMNSLLLSSRSCSRDRDAPSS